MLSVFFFFFSLFLLSKYFKEFWLVVIVYLGLCFFGCLFNLYNPLLSYCHVSYLFYFDLMSVILFLLTLWISGMMVIASQKIYIEGNSSYWFILVVLFLTGVLMLTFSVFNMIFFYVLFEISLVPTLMLIIGWGYQPERLQAGVYLMMYTITASLPLLMSLMYVNYMSGSLYMGFIIGGINVGSALSGLWWFMTLMAFMVKMPMYLTHLWLPKAHVEAPVSGSMVLAGILLKLGGYGLLRMSSMLVCMNSLVVGFFLAVSMWGASMTSLICLRQMDLKSLIAYSSVGHMGLVISGVMTSSSWGWQGALVLMVAHGLVSSGLFAVANMTYENTSTRSIYLTKGMLSILPSMSLFWFILSVMNMGAPPSINLLGEIMLLTSILYGSFMMSVLIGLASFLSAAYSLYLYTATQHGQSSLFIGSVYPGLIRNMTVLFLHMLPVVLLFFSSQFVSMWI